ncbi:MAG: lipid droplet-associated protein [Pseudonocardiaceae bacterium]
MSHVPLPVRVAVGLMVTAVEQARKLPEQLADLPVTAASRAVQAGMRVQQRVTELAIKGDQVFSLFRPVENTPPWARFDEDGEPPRPATDATANGSDKARKAGPPIRPEVGEVDEADVARALTPSPTSAAGAKPGDGGVTPSALAGYDEISLAQLRSRLRRFSLPQLVELLEYEHAHQNRPAFATLLSNRISTVRSKNPTTQ